MKSDENISYKERKALKRLLEKMYIKIKDALYSMDFDEGDINLMIYRKENKYKYHVSIDITPFKKISRKINADINESVDDESKSEE